MVQEAQRPVQVCLESAQMSTNSNATGKSGDTPLEPIPARSVRGRTLSMEAEECRTDCREAERPSSGASIVPPVARMLRHLLSPALRTQGSTFEPAACNIRS